MGKSVVDRLACAELRVKDGFHRPGIQEIQDLAVIERLRRFSPEVELFGEETSTFWLDATGLECLYRDGAKGEKEKGDCSGEHLRKWGEAIRRDLEEIGLAVTLVIGFTRFATYALTRGREGGLLILNCQEAEITAARQVLLVHLGLLPSILGELVKLGRRTVGDLVDLPSVDLMERFGPEVYRLRNWAAGELWDPLNPVPLEDPVSKRLELDMPVSNAVRLTFLAKTLIHGVIMEVAARHQAVVALQIALKLDRKQAVKEKISTARPTLDEVQLIDLVRLRFESLHLRDGVVEMEILAITVLSSAEQLSLFIRRERRDPLAAERVFARLRAEFGPNAVVIAKVTEAHLPEASFAFEPLKKAPSLPRLPSPSVHGRTLVRRLFTHPLKLQSRPVCGPRGCHILGMKHEPFTRFTGPYIVSGGWWVREVHREYYFAETQSGRVLWVYFDKKRRVWFVHGEVS